MRGVWRVLCGLRMCCFVCGALFVVCCTLCGLCCALFVGLSFDVSFACRVLCVDGVVRKCVVCLMCCVVCGT